MVRNIGENRIGGEGGIRTHGARKGTTVFETAPFDHSGTSPGLPGVVVIRSCRERAESSRTPSQGQVAGNWIHGWGRQGFRR